MANHYRSVLASGAQATGDAVAADVLTGKTFSNASAVGVSGTMPNNGAVSQTINAGQSYTIPAGYHNGNGTVSANAPSLIDVQAYGGSGTITVTGAEGKSFRLVTTAQTEPTVQHNGATITASHTYQNAYHDGVNTFNVYEYSGTISSASDTFSDNATTIWYVIVTD